MSNDTQTLSIPVDREHSGLRAVVAGSFILMSLISYFILSIAIPAAYVNLIAILGALVIGAGISYLMEQQLKTRWPSGKVLTIEPDQLTLSIKDRQILQLPINEQTKPLYWNFKIARRTRVPKGWHMAAVAIEDEENTLAAYTLTSPEDFAQLNYNERFTELEKLPEGTSADDMRLAGKQRRLRKAEAVRWQEGVEMSHDDFVRYLHHLERLTSPS